MTAALGRIIIYTHKIEQMVAFYSKHFGYTLSRIEGDRILELKPKDNGIPILLHPASAKQKEGQVLVKLVFDVKDVPAFCEVARGNGLMFGTIFQADGYSFANTKDPSGNTVQVSSRAFMPL